MPQAELLMPVGSPELLPLALAYGADAVYLGSDALSLRAKAPNFPDPALQAAISLTHRQKKKLYLAVNIFARDEDLPSARELFETIAAWPDRPDAFIVSDFGILRLAREICPEIPLHISTQTNTTNAEAFRFWKDLGAQRVVCARELSLKEIADLHQSLQGAPALEAFVHGSMCISYSGRCLISSFLNGRDANRGQCTQPCRWKYYLQEEKRPGEWMPLEETARGTYLYNSRDLCMIEYLPQMLSAGIRSLKVEGRMKNELYVAVIARAYRLALDALEQSEEAYHKVLPWCREEVRKCTRREYCTGFYFGQPGATAQNTESSTYLQESRLLGVVQQDERGLFIRQKNKFSAGHPIEAIRPDGENLPLSIRYFETEAGEKRLDCPHPGEKLYLHSEIPLKPFDVLREENYESI